MGIPKSQKGTSMFFIQACEKFREARKDRVNVCKGIKAPVAIFTQDLKAAKDLLGHGLFMKVLKCIST